MSPNLKYKIWFPPNIEILPIRWFNDKIYKILVIKG
jgi:hypothetical protein